MNVLRALLSDPSGKASATRAVVLLIALLYMLTWAIISVRKMEMQPLKLESNSPLLGALAALVLGKRQEAAPPNVTGPPPA